MKTMNTKKEVKKPKGHEKKESKAIKIKEKKMGMKN